MPPAALFLGRQEIEERTGQRGFPLCNSPTPKINGTGSSARLGMQCADGSLPARSPPLSACAPFRSHARGCVPRRDGKRFLSVLPETGWKLPHSRSRSQAATLMFRSSARRRREYRHIPREGTRRKAVGARSLRAGFLRAEPLGVSFVQPFLHEQKRLAVGDKKKSSANSNLTPKQQAERRSFSLLLSVFRQCTGAYPRSRRPGNRFSGPAC